MPMKKTEDVLGHPLWMLPVMLLAGLLMIEGIHTFAHLHQEIDVHGVCRRNKEVSEMQEDDY